MTENAPMAMIPKLQMSTFGPYSFLVTTSGAIQYGVPTIVVRFAPSEIWAQNPKSAEQIKQSSSEKPQLDVTHNAKTRRTQFDVSIHTQ